MYNSQFTSSVPKLSVIRSFKRREALPLGKNALWQIQRGAVRAFTFAEDGTLIALGFWGSGDIVGLPLAQIQPYEVECLTDVNARALPLSEIENLTQVMLAHLHQTQELLRIRHGQIYDRLQQFLGWLADKFGCECDRGQLIQLRLTHQDIAEVLGTTRVTVTRLMSQLEQEGTIGWSEPHWILWHPGVERL
ncbi:MAG: Crp/Fnr family transcriptional regulator [Desertifilum sp. SIO1I2]|nr:Crp/Fnr family transcriptional regulator [Desertifilum sp. SIO1I2]